MDTLSIPKSIQKSKNKRIRCNDLHDFIEKYLNFWIGWLEFTQKELDTVKELIILYYELEQDLSNTDKIFDFLFSVEYKKTLRARLNISSFNLNNRVMKLKQKGVILERAKGKYKLADSILPTTNLNISFAIEKQKEEKLPDNGNS